MMEKNYWKVFSLFWVYAFPLNFAFIGRFKSNTETAIIALIFGIILWGIFIFSLVKNNFIKPQKLHNEIQRIKQKGKRVEARIEEIINRKTINPTKVLIEVTVSFPNLAGTIIKRQIEIHDTKPRLKRYEVGSKIGLALNIDTNPTIPWVLLNEDTTPPSNKIWDIAYIAFAVVYCVGTFVFFHIIRGNAEDIRWLSFINPWVMSPIIGLFMNGIFLLIKKLTGGSSILTNQLLLHGLSATGKITKSEQTGMYVNKQPQIRYTLAYTDSYGETHYGEYSQIVLISQLPFYQSGNEVNLLYLPKEPNKTMLIF